MKFSKKDEDELSKLVKNFNAKIRRVKKKHPELAFIQPAKLSKSEIKTSYESVPKATYRKAIAGYKKYLERGGEMPYTTKRGVNITLWQKREIDRQFRTINAQRKKEIDKYQPSVFKGTSNAIKNMNLKPRKNTIEEISPKSWGRFVENLEKQAYHNTSKRHYKENYLKAILNEFGEGELYEKFKNVPEDTLYQMYFDSPYLQIDFIYDPHEKDIVSKYMMEELDKYMKRE